MKTIEIKVSELTGTALDWAVAQCEEAAWRAYDEALNADLPLPPRPSEYLRDFHFGPGFSPRVNWTQGGPIIDRVRIKVAPNLGASWHGQIRHEKSHPLVAHRVLAGWTNQHGPTPLIAAMRCHVASTMGNTVHVPIELLENNLTTAIVKPRSSVVSLTCVMTSERIE